MVEELAQAAEEQGPTEELVDASTDESEVSGEQTEGETESKEGDDKPDEETFEKKVASLAQRIADKSTKTITRQRDEAIAKVTDLEGQLNDKMWNHEINALFGEESDSLGEDVAAKNKANRVKMAASYKDFQQRDTQVKKDKEFYDAQVPKLSVIERNQKAREEVWSLIFPEDKAKIDRAAKLIKKFDKANDWDDFELILEGIKEATKAGSKPFVPAGSKTISGTTEDLSNLPIDERIDALLMRGEKKRRQK